MLLRNPSQMLAAVMLAISMTACAAPALPPVSPAATTLAGVEATAQTEPSPQPPDIPSGQVAYVGDDSSLWLLDLATGHARQLTQGEHVYSLAWSPDGRRIAYIRDTNVAGEKEMVLLS